MYGVLALAPLLSLAAAVHPWEVVEVTLAAQSAPANPYVEGMPDSKPPRARVRFTRNGGQAATVPAFWDGGQAWKARFAPPSAGEWSWRGESVDPGMNGASGSFRCEDWTATEKLDNPLRRGFLRVAPGGRHFEYADGTPLLWIGDTWWNWSKKGIRFESFAKLAGDRAAKGFTVGQLFFPGDGALVDANTQLPDLEQIRQVERMIAYANSRGITVWIHPWWSGRGLDRRIGAERLVRWWRYVIARLSAYHVVWVLAGEYNMNGYGGMGLDFWKRLGAMIRAEDPARHLISAHPTPPGWQGGTEAPQWSTGEVLHAEPWFDFNQSQAGHGRWRNEMIPLVVARDYARTPPKPVVITEAWYEFTEGSAPAEDIRFGAWSAILSGAAGHTYGGGHVWWAHLPESPSNQGNWPLEQGFERDTLDYPGAVSMGFLARSLASIEWWKLEPHPELVSDYPAPYCAAEPGVRYLVYARWGGTLKLDLRAARGTLRYGWTDLSAGREASHGTVEGGGVREFHAPADYPASPRYRDWLLAVER